MLKLPMTVIGFASLEAELRRRQRVERPRIVEAIAEARSDGDLPENAEYQAAQETQSLNELRIAELEDMLARADVIDVSKLSGDNVTFGATVALMDDDTGAETHYQIVGDAEADVRSGKISVSSPISRALIGKKVGESVDVHTPGGGKSYKILRIDFI
jgi:transcription elongation factor GreA